MTRMCVIFSSAASLASLNCICTAIIITELANQVFKLCLLKIYPLLRENFAKRCVTHSENRWNCGQSVFQDSGHNYCVLII